MKPPVKRAARAARNALTVVREPLYAQPGNYYSPTSNRQDAERAISWLNLNAPVGVNLREDEQLALLAELGPLTVPGGRYDRGNDQYGPADAAVLAGMLNHIQPNEVIEVGSGWSTAVMLESEQKFDIACIEPYPDRLFARLQPGDEYRLEVLGGGAQDWSVEWFSQLEPGDVLFIDSTHVLKPGSDVAWLYLHVLPTLAPGVWIHIHDIFWPFEYPEVWLQQRRDWTELYLLRALLTGSEMFQVELFTNMLFGLGELRVGGLAPSSIWLRKTR